MSDEKFVVRPEKVNPVARVVDTGAYGYDGPKWRTIYIWCPGCDQLKAIPIPGEDGTFPINHAYWDWNGDLERPTLTPSILQHESGQLKRPLCHSFLRDGRWEFLGDCTHALAGQTVDMVPLPDWVMGKK